MAKLAIKGGQKYREKPFTSWPVFDESEIEAVTDVTKSGKWWRFAYGKGIEWKEKSSGSDRSQNVLFQEEFAEYQFAKYCIACANGTAALEVSLKAIGVGPGDEVLVPSYTYVASATSVLQVNAVPIFVDIDPDTYNIDPNKILEAITKKTKAIMPVHFAGQSADMDRIMEIAEKYNLFVVEDAAHAHGSEWKNKRVGAIGDVGTFSFQASKNMTSGEGGAITTNNEKIAELCESYIVHGRETGRPWYEHYRLGWNYRLTEFQAAILRVQLSRLDDQIEKRNKNAAYLSKKIDEIDGLSSLKIDKRATRHAYHIYIFKFKPEIWGIKKEMFMNALEAEGIPVYRGYPEPIFMNPIFLKKEFYQKGCPLNCVNYKKNIEYGNFQNLNPVTQKVCKKEAIWIEHRALLGEQEDMDDIIGAIKKLQKNIEELI